MSRWDRIPTDFLRYWEKRCVAILADEALEMAERTMNGKKPTAGSLALLDLQGRQLIAIRRELDRREHV